MIGYAILFAMLAAILFPDHMEGYKGFRDYFAAQRPWFYGMLALLFIVDMVDTLLKGVVHFRALGIEYPIRQVVFALCALTAVFVANRPYQTIFVVVSLAYQFVWILRAFDVLD